MATVATLTDNSLDNEFDELEALIEGDIDFSAVPGLPGLLMGVVLPKPYPINIYNLDGRKESGLAGTLHPDGTFVPLPARMLPRVSEHFDEQLKMKIPNLLVWDGNVVGCVEIPDDPDQPMRRLCDGSITGPWPLHPPKPDRLVSPDKARAAALEDEADRRQAREGLI